MKIRYFYPNKDDKIEFTREELERLINDVYDEGKEDGMRLAQPSTITVPARIITPLWYNSREYNDYTTVWCSNDDNAGRCVLEREEYNKIGD